MDFGETVASGNISHAYIIEGSAAALRTAAIRDFAKALMCTGPAGGPLPCGSCASCRRMDAGTNEDLVELGGSVKDLEEMMSRIIMHPNGIRHVAAIYDGDRLSEILQNKLLKTLEEPPEGTVILIGVSNRERLLDTVRSRCRYIRLDENDPAVASEDRAGELLGLLDAGPFYKYAKAVEDKDFLPEDAAEFLKLLEEGAAAFMRESALKDGGASEAGEREKAIFIISLAEEARSDLERKVDHKKVLKRIFLQIKTGISEG